MTALICLIYIQAFVRWVSGLNPVLEFFLGHLEDGTTIRLFGSVTPDDIILGLIYLISIINIRTIAARARTVQFKKRILLFMVWGLVPLTIGWLNENNNIFSYSRLFAWGIIGLLYPVCFVTFNQIYRFIKFILFLHTIRVFYFLIFEVYLDSLWVNKFSMDRFSVFSSAVLIFVLLHSTPKTTYEKFLSFFVLPATVYLSVIDHTRTIYILYILVLLLFFGLSTIKSRRMALIGIVSACTVALTIPFFLDNDMSEAIFHSTEFIDRYKVDDSIQFRQHAIETLLSQIMDRPIFGYGLGVDVSVEDYLSRYNVTEVRTPHNFYLEIAMFGGFSTLIFYLYLMCSIAFAGLRQYLALKSDPKSKINLILLGCVLIAICDIIGRAPTPSAGVSSYIYWHYFAMLITAMTLARRKTTETAGMECCSKTLENNLKSP